MHVNKTTAKIPCIYRCTCYASVAVPHHTAVIPQYVAESPFLSISRKPFLVNAHMSFTLKFFFGLRALDRGGFERSELRSNHLKKLCRHQFGKPFPHNHFRISEDPDRSYGDRTARSLSSYTPFLKSPSLSLASLAISYFDV